MEIVRVTEAYKLAPEDQRSCEATKAWFKIDFVPKMSRVLLPVPDFGRPYGRASRRAVADGALTRAQREILAFAASMTGKSDYGVDFHLREARRLGLTDQVLTEAVEVVQLFNTVTKIADALCPQPDIDARRSDQSGAHHRAASSTPIPSRPV